MSYTVNIIISVTSDQGSHHMTHVCKDNNVISLATLLNANINSKFNKVVLGYIQVVMRSGRQ